MKLFIGILLILLLGLDCSSSKENNISNQASSASENLDKKLPSRYDLYQKYRDHELLFVINHSSAQIYEQYQSLVSELKNELPGRRQSSISIKSVKEIKDVDYQNKIIYLVGIFKGHPILDKLGKSIPLSVQDESFVFNESIYASKGDILTLRNYPSPIKRSMPINIMIGNDEGTILKSFEEKIKTGSRFYWSNFDLQIQQNGARTMIASFDGKWELDKDLVFNFDGYNEPEFSSELVDIYTDNNYLSELKLKEIADDIVKRIETVKAISSSDKVLPKIKYYVYKTAEEKGLQLSNSNQAHVDFKTNSVHTIINEKYQDNFIEKENQLIIQHLIGQSKSQIIANGLGIYLTKKWQREGYEYWGARLAESMNFLSLQELHHEDVHNLESPLIVDCMSGLMVKFLVDKMGMDDFIAKFLEWSPEQTYLEALEQDWIEFLELIVKNHPKKQRSKRDQHVLKGFNFAHEGYRIYDGYLSKQATKSIEKQVELACNAMAIVPYSYMSDHLKPNPLRIPDQASQENDEGVIHSAYEAKLRGMKTMLKPQIWFRGSWPGALEMQSAEDWQLFYKYYHSWIRHYALLAEIHEIDMLSLGVEFVKSTLSHEAEWRKIIRSVRGIYQGQLTYSANWGDEFEKISFWDDLDFIGLNSYYPLSKSPEAKERELRASFEKIKRTIKAVSDRFQKPVVFTEIGFRSIKAPWINPHAEDSHEFYEEDQDLCYRIVMEGIQNESWYGGILWWKYPSYLGYKGQQNNSFTPNNKLAEESIRHWFAKD